MKPNEHVRDSHGPAPAASSPQAVADRTGWSYIERVGFDALHPSLRHHIVNTLGWPSLRPLQEQAIGPLAAGEHALLLAPTAGGKTEAATFPTLSRMAAEGWTGLSVLYLAPLRALLNNLEPRLVAYGGYVGRRVGKWHGDVGPSARRRMLAEPPDLLLTTPESLEAMLISERVEHRALFADLRVVIVDEIHAFAADDRGWHLQAVLARLEHLAGRPVQRIGLSATVGNPGELLGWLTTGSDRPARVLDPAAPPGPSPAIELDHVGSIENAATVIAALHLGEKRLVFVDSRAGAERLGRALRDRGVTTFLSHGSLGRDDRRQTEAAFEQASNCVIVATSTLELGVDIGDLDRMIQIDSPSTVSAFLQRIGRTGRRAELSRNALVLATRGETLVQAAALLHLHDTGFVEPVVAPPLPLHLLAQQLLALMLQEGTVGFGLWREWLGDPLALGPEVDARADEVTTFLADSGFVHLDGGMTTVGVAGERAFGARHFLDLTASFTSPPVFAVMAGRREVGTVERNVLSLGEPGEGPAVLLLGGRPWQVRSVDWSRRVVRVEPVEGGQGRARWRGGTAALSFTLCRAIGEVLAGTDPAVTMTDRAVAALDEARRDHPWVGRQATRGSALVTTGDGRVRWFTFAGRGANAMLAAMLGREGVAVRSFADLDIRLDDGVDADRVADAIRAGRPQRPAIPHEAVTGLKFADALPPALAHEVLARRLEDRAGADAVLAEPVHRHQPSST